jgi:hypothetical protein
LKEELRENKMRNPAFDNNSGFNQNSYGDFDDSGHGQSHGQQGGGLGVSAPSNDQWFSSSPSVI